MIESVGWGESVKISIGFYGLLGGPLDYVDFLVAEPEHPFLLLLEQVSKINALEIYDRDQCL